MHSFRSKLPYFYNAYPFVFLFENKNKKHSQLFWFKNVVSRVIFFTSKFFILKSRIPAVENFLGVCNFIYFFKLYIFLRQFKYITVIQLNQK